jgi:hypothetical protein
MKNIGFTSQENDPRAQKRYVRPSCAILTPDQVRVKLAAAPPDDKQAQEWIAMIGNTPRKRPDSVRQEKGPDSVRQDKGPDGISKQLRSALKHLSNAQKDGDLAAILDALELAYAKDCIAGALRDYEAKARDSAAS